MSDQDTTSTEQVAFAAELRTLLDGMEVSAGGRR
jgi:hypothetical protein